MRFIEEVEPPKSIKKKASRGDNLEDTSTKSLLISNWSDLQISSYCDVCGIAFTDAADDCIHHIHLLEQSHAASARDPATIYSENRVI